MATTVQGRQTITCYCKAVRIEFPTISEPACECLCGICRRYGALWAYYKPDLVKVEGETEGYSHGRKNLSFNRCKHCGCVTHYSVLKDTEPRIAVNCRMLEQEEYKNLDSYESDGD